MAITFAFEEWRLTLPAGWTRFDERALCKAGPELGQLQISSALATDGPPPAFSHAELDRIALGTAANTRFAPVTGPKHYKSGDINIVHLDAGANEKFNAHIWVAGVPGLLLLATYMTPIGAHKNASAEIEDAESAFRSIALVRLS